VRTRPIQLNVGDRFARVAWCVSNPRPRSSLVVPATVTSLVELLELRALAQTAAVAYTFLRDGERDERTITYGQLDARAHRLGASLCREELRGERCCSSSSPTSNSSSRSLGVCMAAPSRSRCTRPTRPA
jgi:hypothetical protein